MTPEEVEKEVHRMVDNMYACLDVGDNEGVDRWSGAAFAFTKPERNQGYNLALVYSSQIALNRMKECTTDFIK